MRVRAVLINSHIIIIILLFVGVEGRGEEGVGRWFFLSLLQQYLISTISMIRFLKFDQNIEQNFPFH